jgi:hypothetical protein
MNDAVASSHLDEHRQLLTANRYASTVVFNILDRALTIDSILDLGCGTGVWMRVALCKPGRTVLGIDRESYPAEDLLVPSECIINTTVDGTVDLHRRFDLVLCLETAEHIVQDQAGCVVTNCVRHSDLVLFSAAIPGQGGLSHVNEQPPEFWQRLFDEAGYEVIDYIRPLIWDDAGIPVWYRQNMLLFVNRKAPSNLDALHAEAKKASVPLSRAHPSLFKWQADRLASCTARLSTAHSDLDRLRGETQSVNAALETTIARQRRALAEAEMEKRQLQAAVTQLEEKLDTHRDELARITAERADLQADVGAQCEHAGRALSKAWDLIRKLHGEREEEARRTEFELTRLRVEIEQLSQVRAEFLASTSWKVTAPLRWVSIWLRPRRQ